MDKWFKEVAKRFFITPILARYILLEEYKNILLDSKTLNTEELNKRYNNCAYLLENGKIKLYSGEQAKKCWKLFYKEKNNSNVLAITGSIAYPGKRKGVVKIVNSTNDLAKFKKGDILVSYSTNPSLMPALNIASAIITNTGGITCHAAIISRELKIPCIIGTNNATKILKDGDIVEVDADNGIVKILK
jgi:pyruvate,water dikinase